MSRGITLIEVIVTLVVVASLVTVVAINAARTRERHQLESIAEQVVSLIKTAQSYSIAAAPVNTAPPPFSVEINSSSTQIKASDNSTVTQFSLPSGITADSFNTQFAVRTGEPSSAGSFNLQSSHFELQINVTRNGQISANPANPK